MKTAFIRGLHLPYGLLLLLGVALIGMDSAEANGVMRPASEQDRKLFSKMSQAFSTSSLKAEVAKQFRVELTQQSRNSSGRLEINRGRVRLELNKGDENSLLVVNSKEVLAVTMPPADLPNTRVQVVRLNRRSASAKKQGLLALLAESGFEKSFSITGVRDGPDGTEYFLSPLVQDMGLKRAQIRIDASRANLRELRYWDELGNETSLTFSAIKLGDKIPMSRFVYQIPKDAEILSESN